MAIRQSASEGRALTISVSARFPLGPVICPDQARTSADFLLRGISSATSSGYTANALGRHADMERPRATDLLVQCLHLPGALGRKHALQLKLCVG
jgi:hypothetical protein